MDSLGKHIILELYHCNQQKLNDHSYLEKAMITAAELAGASIVGSHFHEYSPHGLSGMVIIKESHLAVHTWPEFSYAAVDFFTCSEKFVHECAIDYLIQELESEEYESKVIERGEFSKVNRESTSNN